MSEVHAAARDDAHGWALAPEAAAPVSLPRYWTSSRVGFLGAVAVYIAVFWITYVLCVARNFEYFGYGYDLHWTSTDVIFVVTLAFVPALWMQVRVTRPSQLFLLIQYIVVYIPALFIAHHSVLPILDPAERTLLCVVLFCSMSILQLGQSWPLLRIPRTPLPKRLYMLALWICLGLGVAYLAAVLGGNFRLVSITDIYDLRDEATELIEESGSRAGNYVFTWLNGMVLPLLFAIYTKRRQWSVIAVVFAAYLFLYGIWGSKVSLLAPMYLIGLYLLMNRSSNQVSSALVLACAGFLFVPLLVPGQEGSLMALARGLWIGIVNVRMFSIPGLLIAQYLQFFSDHPATLGSHITGLNAFIHYPYDNDIPRTVGFHFYGTPMTANVNYWAQDGVAGFGLGGVPVISFLAAVTFWLLDSLTRTVPLRLTMVALGPVLLTIANASLFTTLVTGGLLLFFVAFAFAPRDL